MLMCSTPSDCGTALGEASPRTMRKPNAGFGSRLSRGMPICSIPSDYDTNVGRGGLKNDVEAVRWYRLAAEQGHALAQYGLGVMYATGGSIAEDLVFAHMWFRLSVAQGNETAEGNRDAVEQRMTSEQIAEAQGLAREWTETHPQDGGN